MVGGYAARRRIRRALTTCVIAVIVAALVFADARGWLLARGDDDMALYHGIRASVIHVIDGDTIDIAIRDPLSRRPATRIRLWGIDCPEESHFDSPAQPLADQATQFSLRLIGTQRVQLRLESQQTRDSIGRLLAHVALPDGTILNESLLEAGLATAEDRWPHAMLVRYQQLEQAAKRRRIGIWLLEKN